ncbi:MAG TPA: hypothetical protein VE291_02725 [Terracidiphilus sp.]|jgi:hypothetical protein|nr:hypothetical protein [Terracidiphilus sp.]
MPALHRLPLLAFVLIALPVVLAQKEPRQPLTAAQTEQIRDAGTDPDQRIGLYTKFLNERVDAVKSLAARGHSSARTARLDGDCQDLAALMDELGSNLDQYGDRKADLRKSLKELNEAAPRWISALRTLPTEPGYDLSRKDAIASGQDLADQVADLLKEQTAYFAAHKDEKGQERAEPK